MGRAYIEPPVFDTSGVNDATAEWDKIQKTADISPTHIGAGDALSNFNQSLSRYDNAVTSQFDQLSSTLHDVENATKSNLVADGLNVDKIRSTETSMKEKMSEYNSYLEFNDRTKDQIARLEMQLNLLIAIDVILAVGIVCFLGYKFMGRTAKSPPAARNEY